MADIPAKDVLSKIKSNSELKKAALEAVFVKDTAQQGNAQYRNPWYQQSAQVPPNPNLPMPGEPEFYTEHQARDCLDALLAEAPAPNHEVTPQQALIVERCRPQYQAAVDKRMSKGLGCYAVFAAALLFGYALLGPAPSGKQANELRNDVRQFARYLGGAVAAGLALYGVLRCFSKDQQNPNQPNP